MERIGVPDYRLFIRGDEVEYHRRLANSGLPFGTALTCAYLHPDGSDEFKPILGGRMHTQYPDNDTKRFFTYRNRGYLQAQRGLRRLIPQEWVRFGWFFLVTRRDPAGLREWLRLRQRRLVSMTRPHLAALEAESIEILREVAGQFDRPALLFSGGKDSVVVLELAKRAFAPAAVPFELLHVDTGHNFPEVLSFRDRTVERLGLRLVVASVQDYIDDGRLRERNDGTRNPLQTIPLLDAIAAHRFDGVFGGGRRDEEKARAKECVVSLRDEFGQWDPRNQRPELWHLYNPRHRPGEHVRVFPLSNWTELDIWRYIAREQVLLPSIYYAHEREVYQRDGMWMTSGVWGGPREGEEVQRLSVRYRTVGDMSCTGAVLSDATSIEDVIDEIRQSTTTERGATRADDKLSESSMEDRKKEGYF